MSPPPDILHYCIVSPRTYFALVHGVPPPTLLLALLVQLAQFIPAQARSVVWKPNSFVLYSRLARHVKFIVVVHSEYVHRRVRVLPYIHFTSPPRIPTWLFQKWETRTATKSYHQLQGGERSFVLSPQRRECARVETGPSLALPRRRGEYLKYVTPFLKVWFHLCYAMNLLYTHHRVHRLNLSKLMYVLNIVCCIVIAVS